MSRPGAPRLAFFGLPGPYAAKPLQALCAAGLAPVVVIEGLERRPNERSRTSAHPVGAPGGWRARLGLEPKGTGGLVEAAHALGLDALRTNDANAPKTVSRLERMQLDAMVVCGFPHLFGPRLLAVARRGGLNLHPGKLPAERGPAPLFWALKSGRTSVDWTLHVLDRGEDTGDVVATGTERFEPGTRALAILESVAVAASPALVRAVRSLLDGDLVRIPQPPPSTPRGPRPGFRDARIDPGRSAEAIYTFVAGCAGRYPLFYESAGDRYFVADAISYDPAGELSFEYALTGDRLLLRCHPGVVELKLREDGALFAAEW